ncbi:MULTISPECIES: transglycosylase family protein [unclassified Corynebacterium]|uniref:transglycosylase family protein n=1 Tax=unclassified Corynebacterium TaxID=2624378 RepID=UPI00309A501B
MANQKQHINRQNNKISTPQKLVAGGLTVAFAATGGVAAAGYQNVTVDIDGEIQQVSTIYGDQQRILDRAGITAGPKDIVREQGNLKDGGKLVYRSAKPVHLVVDGKETQITTNAVSVDELIKSLPNVADTDDIDAPKGRIPAEGIKLSITTAKDIVLQDGGKEQPLNIAAATVGDVLKQRGIKLGKSDTVSPSVDTKLTDGMLVDVSRIIEKTIEETKAIEPTEQVVEDADLYEDERVVDTEGVAGEKLVEVKVTTRDGVEMAREVLKETEVKAPTATVIRQGTKARPSAAPAASSESSAASSAAAAPAVANGSVWDSLAQCESGGNWHIDTGNGFSGGLQFHPQTWQAYGGGAYAPTAAGASREQQIAIAEKVQASQGWGAWPACSAQLGLL